MARVGYADADSADWRAQDEYSNDVFPLSPTLSSTETLAAIVAPTILFPVPDILSPPRTIAGNFAFDGAVIVRSEEHTSELQSRRDLVCRLLLEKKKV